MEAQIQQLLEMMVGMKEEMKKGLEESRKAQEEAKEEMQKGLEESRKAQEEAREEMKKGLEESRKAQEEAREEMKKSHDELKRCIESVKKEIEGTKMAKISDRQEDVDQIKAGVVAQIASLREEPVGEDEDLNSIRRRFSLGQDLQTVTQENFMRELAQGDAANNEEMEARKRKKSVGAMEEGDYRRAEKLAAMEEGDFRRADKLATMEEGDFRHADKMAAMEEGDFGRADKMAAMEKEDFRRADKMAAMEEGDFRRADKMAAMEEGDFRRAEHYMRRPYNKKIAEAPEEKPSLNYYYPSIHNNIRPGAGWARRKRHGKTDYPGYDMRLRVRKREASVDDTSADDASSGPGERVALADAAPSDVEPLEFSASGAEKEEASADAQSGEAEFDDAALDDLASLDDAAETEEPALPIKRTLEPPIAIDADSVFIDKGPPASMEGREGSEDFRRRRRRRKRRHTEEERKDEDADNEEDDEGSANFIHYQIEWLKQKVKRDFETKGSKSEGPEHEKKREIAKSPSDSKPKAKEGEVSKSSEEGKLGGKKRNVAESSRDGKREAMKATLQSRRASSGNATLPSLGNFDRDDQG